jgi:NADH-quinone oxidoreductase subunit L
MVDVFEYAYLIVLFPLISFVLILALGKKVPGKGAYLAISAISISLILSLLVAFKIFTDHGKSFSLRFPWIYLNNGSISFMMGYTLDTLSSVMLLVVTIVSLLVFIFSIGYMDGDKRYTRFFAYLSLFSASMLGLVLADNLLLLYVFWEGVGLSSYFLIGFWFEKRVAARAAKKAFLVTRVGDVGLFLAILILFATTGSFSFSEIFQSISQNNVSNLQFLGIILAPQAVITLVGILIFFGAAGKSAQFPLHIWLPDAMEGPTPVSALIHAATMVAAGVYLVARTFPIFFASSFSLFVVSHIGAITVLLGATIAVLITDIKRILAYSTISQLGYMMLALGTGGYSAGIFHLFAHAFFKALLFLGSGSIIHSTKTQDIWKMGGLYKKMKITTMTFIIGSLALAGIPPLSGFWSKDEIVLSSFNYGNHTGFWIPFAFAFIGVFLTALYMTRLCIVVFFGKETCLPTHRQRSNDHIHESPKVMTYPLIILAIFAIFAGFVGTPFYPKFQHFVSFQALEEKPNFILMTFSVLTALSGILIGYILYGTKLFDRKKIINILPYTYKVLKNKYYIDEFYNATVIRLLFFLSEIFSLFDKYVVDGIVNLVGYTTYALSLIHNIFDKYIVDGIVNLIGWFTKKTGDTLKYLQTGLVQNYILIAFLGLFFILLWRWQILR